MSQTIVEVNSISATDGNLKVSNNTTATAAVTADAPKKGGFGVKPKETVVAGSEDGWT